MTFYAPPTNRAALSMAARRTLRRRKPLVLAACAALGLIGYGGAQVIARALSPDIAPVRAKVAASRAPFEMGGAQPGAARLYADPASGWEIRSAAVAPLEPTASEAPPHVQPLEALLRATRAAPAESRGLPAEAPDHDHDHDHNHDPEDHSLYGYADARAESVNGVTGDRDTGAPNSASDFASDSAPDSGESLVLAAVQPNVPSAPLLPSASALSELNTRVDAILAQEDPELNQGYVRREIRIDAPTPLRQALIASGVSEADADAAADKLPGALKRGDLVEISLAPAAYRFDLRDAADQDDQALFAVSVTGADGSHASMRWPMISAFSSSDAAVEVVRLSPQEAAQRLEQIREESARRARELDGPVLVRAEINSSLYVDAQRAGLTRAQTGALAHMFQSLVNFQRDIRRGDSVVVLFDRDWGADGSYEDGPIRYAALSNRGRVLELFRFTPEGGSPGYYDAQGRSNKRSLLKTPIEGARISSRYGMRRHPVLGYNRMHKGVDFAARRGTPVLAAGDGVIEHLGRRGSFGKYIRIRHNGDYSTAYAHLNGYRRGLSRGDRVRQGQVIGCVGSTGRSTGPHLHYEVLQNGRQINPMRVSNFEAERLRGAQARGFSALRDSVSLVIAGLESSARERRVAQND